MSDNGETLERSSELAQAREERDALRVRLAEVERERDELTTKCVVYVVRLAEVERERDKAREAARIVLEECDDARRVAKGLAIVGIPVDHPECDKAMYDAALDAALAYEVEP